MRIAAGSLAISDRISKEMMAFRKNFGVLKKGGGHGQGEAQGQKPFKDAMG